MRDVNTDLLFEPLMLLAHCQLPTGGQEKELEGGFNSRWSWGWRNG